MSLWVSIVCALALSRVAAANPASGGVELDDGVPFTAEELGAALAVRFDREVHVVITSTADGVIVSIDGAARAVPLGGARGEAAARLVALAASDLVLVDLATPPTSAPGEVGVAPRARAAPRVTSPPTTIAATGGAATGWDGVLGGLTVNVAVPRGAWVATVDVGGVTLLDSTLDLMGAVVRVGGGRRVGWVDVRLGVTAVPISIGDGDGDRTVLLGGGASAWFRLPLTRRVHAILVGGVDAFATRTEYTMAGASVAATPWIAPWFGAGVEVAP